MRASDGPESSSAGLDCEALMLSSLRWTLLVGIAPLLVILVALGLWAVVMFYRLGGNIDVILRENYRSVLAAQTMKEALERMDSSLLFTVGGQERRARETFREFRPVFEASLDVERSNVTLPVEGGASPWKPPDPRGLR